MLSNCSRITPALSSDCSRHALPCSGNTSGCSGSKKQRGVRPKMDVPIRRQPHESSNTPFIWAPHMAIHSSQVLDPVHTPCRSPVAVTAILLSPSMVRTSIELSESAPRRGTTILLLAANVNYLPWDDFPIHCLNNMNGWATHCFPTTSHNGSAGWIWIAEFRTAMKRQVWPREVIRVITKGLDDNEWRRILPT